MPCLALPAMPSCYAHDAARYVSYAITPCHMPLHAAGGAPLRRFDAACFTPCLSLLMRYGAMQCRFALPPLLRSY